MSSAGTASKAPAFTRFSKVDRLRAAVPQLKAKETRTSNCAWINGTLTMVLTLASTTIESRHLNPESTPA